MFVAGEQWLVEFNGTQVDSDNDLVFWGNGENSILKIGRGGAFESIIRGNIKAINVDVTMDKGTVQSSSVTLENAKWLMYGGYCNISKITTDGQQKVTLHGGYFDVEPTDPNIQVGNNRKMLPISGNAGDANYDPAYKEGYSYGVYAVKNDAASLNQGTITYDSQPVVPGEDFTIAPNGTTLLEYSCTDAAGSPVSGWPTNAGAYTIRAKCLNAVEKWYAEKSFVLTISKATPAYTEPTGLTARLGKPLSDVALPQGWAWKNGAAVPEQAADLAEIGGVPHLGHGGPDDLDGDDAHGGYDPFAEDLRHAGFDVGHRFGIVFGEPPADVVEVAAQKLAGILVEGEHHRTDAYVYSLFHGRNGFCRVIFCGFYYFDNANIKHFLVLCNTKYSFS